jgi:hypothetical protein
MTRADLFVFGFLAGAAFGALWEFTWTVVFS